jgi:hypothetical protein
MNNTNETDFHFQPTNTGQNMTSNSQTMLFKKWVDYSSLSVVLPTDQVANSFPLRNYFLEQDSYYHVKVVARFLIRTLARCVQGL